MKLKVLSGRANPQLAEAVASALSVPLGRCRVEDFPDGECQVEIHEDVKERDVYLIQPTGPPAAAHLVELLLMADACRRLGAARLTAVVPYLAYARQDHRRLGTEAIGARLIADLLCTRFHRLVVVDLHDPAVEGFFHLPVEHLTAVPVLEEALHPFRADRQIIVAPDLGAVKLAQQYADDLGAEAAFLHKQRVSGNRTTVLEVIGDVRERSPVVVDDMISTGGTVASAIEALLERGCAPEVTVVASHGLFVGDAAERLAALPIREVIVTDSVRPAADIRFPLRTASLERDLAGAITRMHAGSP